MSNRAAAITSKGLFRNGKNKGKNANAPFQRDGAISALRGALDSIRLFAYFVARCSSFLFFFQILLLLSLFV